MNTEQLSRLAGRADHVTGRADDRVAEVHARIRTTRRRRTTGAVLGTAAVVLAVLAGATLLGGSDPAPEPAPSPDRVEQRSAGVVRPLTWTDEYLPSRRVQYGDHVIDTRLDLTDGDFKQMDLTDDGIVLTTSDRRIWFADRSSVEQIAETHIPPGDFAEPEVTTGTSGSLAAWFDEVGRSQRLVVYDTALGRVVARQRCDLTFCAVSWVGTESVYWGGWNERPRRLEVASGEVDVVPQRVLVEEMLGEGRALVFGEDFAGGDVTDGIGHAFAREGDRLRAAPLGAGATPLRTTSVFDSTGAPVRLRVPDGYDEATGFEIFQWLDDDRVAMMAGAGGYPTADAGYGDILICRISREECRLAVPGPDLPADYQDSDSWDGDELGSPDWVRIVPHYGTPGTN